MLERKKFESNILMYIYIYIYIYIKTLFYSLSLSSLVVSSVEVSRERGYQADGSFVCSNGATIEGSFVCDGLADCEDDFDETETFCE